MYIRQLRIDQFGACADFEIAALAPGLTVIHGPRGAGKSTITAFLQGTLYGYDTPLAARFIAAPAAAPAAHPQGQAFRVTRDGSSWNHETAGSPRGQRPLGGSLSLALSLSSDRPRDTRLLERYHHGDAERLRLSRPLAESDIRSGSSPRPDQETENATVSLDPAAIDTLYAGLPPRFLADLFVLDFERTTRLGAILEQAERYGAPLVDGVANPARVAELEGELTQAREQRAAIVDPGASPETLAERRVQLRDELAELESRARRQHDDRARWRRQLATLAAALERQLATLTREIESLDATLATLVERRRHLAAAIRPVVPADARDPAVNDELQKLDEQLDRWRRTLGELITAKGHAAELADASDRMLASGAAANAMASPASNPATHSSYPGSPYLAGAALDTLSPLRRMPGALFGLADAELSGLPAGDPLRRLAELEASAFAITELLAKTQTVLREHAPPLIAADISEALDRQHQMLRGQTRQLAESLTGWRHWITKRAAADEQQQLLRSEIEFRRAIAALEERRQKLLGKSADPAALPVAARTDTLDECQRLMERRDSILRRRQEAARQLADAQRLLADQDSPTAKQDWTELDAGAIHAVDLDPAAIERQLRELRMQATRSIARTTGAFGASSAEAPLGESPFPASPFPASPFPASPFPASPFAESTYVESLASQIDAKNSLLMRVERDLTVAERRRELARRCEELERQLSDERARRTPHPVLLEAGEFLGEMTDGRLPGIARDSRGYLRVATADGGWLDWDALTDAAQDQVALAMHVALARDFRRRGVQLPLVINEPFARYADRELAPAIRQLQRFADQVQILCFTGDERAARAARHAGVALGWLRVDADGRPALFDTGRSANDTRERPVAAGTPFATVNATQAGARTAERDELPPTRASWGVRRPHAWDSEEFPGELADRRRFAAPSAPSRTPSGSAPHDSLSPHRPARGLETRGSEPESLDSGRFETGRFETGKFETGKFETGKFETGDFENSEFAAAETPPRFLLNRAELAAHAPSITGLLAQRLEDRGVRTVGDLLAVNADTLAVLLGDVSAKAIRGWQTQAELACRVPGLRATDCRILASLQIGSVEKLAALKPAELWKRVSQATDSGDWDRMAPGVSPPDPATISNWIHAARRARSLAAA